MAQFDGGKYKDGILSYNYLGGKGGKGKGGVSIRKIKGDWHFVDSKGEVRTNVGIKGKLTPTHIKNLEDDNIFAAAEIKPDGTKLSKAEIKTGVESSKAEIKVGPDLGSSKSDKGTTGTGNLPLAESNYSLAPVAQGGMQAQSDWADKGFTSEAAALKGSYTPPKVYQGGPEGLEGVNYEIPPEVPLPDQTMTSSPHGTEWELPTRNIHGETQSPYGRGDTFHQTSLGNQTSSNTFTPPQELAGQNESTGFGQDRMSGPSYGATPSYQRSFSSDPAALNTGKLEVGTGGDRGLFEVDDDFYRNKDGTLMKDAGWWGDDTVATQADIDAGITDQASPGMTSAAGWEAAGSVMKGVGGLASAYTGIKNYQLARDAHATQKQQWQLNYDQRLKAYQDNKDLANQEIQERNRILKSRNPNRTDLYKEL